MPFPRRFLGLLVGIALAACGVACSDECAAPAVGGADTEWPSYGNDPGGTRFVAVGDITRENVACLEPAWTFHTGDLPASRGRHRSRLASEVTPILADGSLYLCTPYNRVIALDPETGTARWTFDPEIDLSGHYGNQLVCRGVSAWLDPEAPRGAVCRRRILTATNDARLFALDAATGRPCADFGNGGSIDLNPGVGLQEWRGEYQITSPPAVSRDAVIVGAAVSDNQRTNAPSGVVRAYDARSGALRWAWDLRPPDFVATPDNTSAEGYALATPNAWAPMAVDVERDLVFVPTGNPAPDYYRGDSNIDHYGSSVVALRASSGEVVWRFQTVHRDLWDFDVPAQPTLFTLRKGGAEIPALVQATKMGLLFVLNRETGEPLFPVEERAVPQLEVPGEKLSPTQPFPVKPPPLSRHSLSLDEAFGFTPWDRRACRRQLEALRFEGIYTPPTLEGTLMVPGNAGGSNWGGVAVDEARQRLVANTQDLAFAVRLIPREGFDIDQARERGEDAEYAPMRGTPFAMQRTMLMSPLGVPCMPPPWGRLAAVDLASGEISWQVTLGTIRDLTPIPLPIELGTPTLGGPLLTESGLVFIGATVDYYLRAFDAQTGEEMWKGRLPTAAFATPMSYRAGGRQYVVVAAMGYGRGGIPVDDTLIAFALPREE
jgi:quinoprotein glucose dehydrogenase